MDLLLIDNSNTRTKFTTGGGDGLGADLVRVPTRELTGERVRSVVDSFAYEAVVISSVVPDKAALLRETLADRPVHEISARSDLPIAIDYPDPDQIGADRLANAVAVHACCGAPAIVIDFGTAVTFDIVGPAGEGGSYLGGVIAPGLASMTSYLHQQTALLPEIDLAEPEQAIGRSTTEAMRAGAIYGYRGMIREILAAVRRELPDDPAVVATGGDAGLIARGLPEVGSVVPDLTLQGIELIGRRNI